MAQKVVIIGHGYTSRLGVIRALGKAGYEIIVIVMTSFKKDGTTLNDSKPIDCFSKYVSRVLYCPSNKQRLIDLLLDECSDPEQKVVIFTDSDFSAATVDENQDLLREHFLFPHIKHEPGAVVAWMNKLKQKQEAQSLGLNVAEGWVIEIEEGCYSIPSDLRYPCFPKPMATIYGGKRGLCKCENERQLRAVIQSIIMRNANISLLVEEFKTITTEHALMGFTDGKEVIIPGIIKTVSLANGAHFGVAKQGVIMPITGFEDLVESFRQFVLKTEFVGIFDIDFYESEGDYYFCEMNFRYGGSGYAYTAMGVNLPVMMVRSLQGEPIGNMPRDINKEAVFVNERMLREDWAENYISNREFCRMLKTADISFLSDSEDRGPQRMYYRDVMNPMRQAKRLIKRVIRRR